LSGDEAAHQQAIAFLTPFRHWDNRGVRRLALTLGIEVQASAQDKAVKAIQERVDVHVLAEGRDKNGETAGGHNGVKVPRMKPRVRGTMLGSRQKIRVNADERTGRLRHLLSSLIETASGSD